VSTNSLLQGGRVPATLLPLEGCQEAGDTCVASFLSLDAEQRTLFRRRRQKAKGQAGLANNAYVLHRFYRYARRNELGAILARGVTQCNAPLRTSA
jgi:hypothetical protein